ncbi:M20 family metallopeptidase [Brevibacterium renqingii]|uniref:M20 family metallopeptidase n=1 Tax=Brevibacterium renqingii TaxID=2776916 RepID=UPI001AE089EE|nr:M20 family metallopeptidase [Brevibacterium renqingii]
MSIKELCQRNVEAAEEALLGISHRIHADPELGFEEFRAAELLSTELEQRGFALERGLAEMPTAFKATLGDGPLTVGICVEYDALPGIGHACGHNVIAAAGMTAAFGLAPLVDELGITLVVFGTPAEENGGGKVLLLEAGAFDGVDLAMMVHPSNKEQSRTHCLAIGELRVRFIGKNAHASAAPYEGINAADAATLTQVAVGLLRQQLHPGDQIHGFISHGGEAANVIPAETELVFNFRSPKLETLNRLEQRIRACVEGAATATGCRFEADSDAPAYSEFNNNDVLADLYKANAEALGRVFDHEDDTSPVGSTDMANVSRVVPAIHPMIDIDCGPAVNHQPEFAAHCVSAPADRAAIEGGLSMAWTVIDVATDEEARRSFSADRQHSLAD